MIRVLRRAQEVGLYWSKAQDMGDKAVSEALFPTTDGKLHYKLPDYEAVHTAMAQPGVTLQLLWIEYCDRCHDADALPYQLTQFKKYYRQFVQRTKATMHIQRKPGEHMEVDWAGQTAELTDPDTGEVVKAYKACMGLLQMAETYTPQRLDGACAKALRYSPRPSWKSVQTILKSGQDLIREEESESAKPSNVGFTRGAAYFGRGRD